jgi:hypothetical protein
VNTELDFGWDEQVDPPHSTLCYEGLQTYASSMGSMQGGRPMNYSSRGTPMVTGGPDLSDEYTYVCLVLHHYDCTG